MDRLIKANALKESVRKKFKALSDRCEINELVNDAPTIDAIPVAWLEDKLNATAVTNPDLNNAIFYTLVAWEQQKQNHEQEAR